MYIKLTPFPRVVEPPPPPRHANRQRTTYIANWLKVYYYNIASDGDDYYYYSVATDNNDGNNNYCFARVSSACAYITFAFYKSNTRKTSQYSRPATRYSVTSVVMIIIDGRTARRIADREVGTGINYVV